MSKEPPLTEREKILCAALGTYANDEDAYLAGHGEPYGSIPTEVGIIARQARAIVAKAAGE